MTLDPYGLLRTLCSRNPEPAVLNYGAFITWLKRIWGLFCFYSKPLIIFRKKLFTQSSIQLNLCNLNFKPIRIFYKEEPGVWIRLNNIT